MATNTVLNIIVNGEDNASSTLDGVSSSLGRIGESAMRFGGKLSLGVTTPLAAMGLMAVNSASDLEESLNKVSVVFGENAGAIEAWSATASTGLGQSQQGALEAVGTFGNLFSAMGLGQDESANMSMGLVQLASDLASFNNIDPTEALEKLRSGLVGETEPLRTLGVNLSAASVEAYALEQGLADTKAELTPAMLAQARYALILKQTTLAQGDYARTADGLANKQRSVSAQIADLTAKLGTLLLPIATTIIGKVSELVGWFSNLDPKIQKVLVVIAGLAAAAGPVILVIGMLASGIGAIVTIAGPVITVVGAIGAGIGAIAAPVMIVIAAIALLAAAWRGDFAGIRTTVTEFWENTLKPIFEKLVLWFKTNIPIAIAVLAGFWENTLKPAIEKVWAFLQEHVIPIIETLVNVWFALLKLEIELLAAFWESTLKPAIEKVWEVISTYIIPIIEQIINETFADLKVVIEELAKFWEEKLKPAIETVWRVIVQDLIPGLVDLKAKIEGVVRRALETAKRLFDDISGAVNAVKDAISGVIEWFNRMKDAISNWSPPAWVSSLGGTIASIASGLGHAAETAEQFGGALAQLGPEVDSIQKISAALLSLVNAFVAVAGYDPKQIGPNLNILFDQLRGVIFKLEKLSLLISDKAIGYATALAEAGGKIVGQLKTMVDGFTAVAGYEPQKIGPTLNILFDQLRGVIFKLQKTALLVNMAGLPAAQALAEAGGKITGQLKAMVDGFTAVAGYEPQQLGPALNVLFEQLREVVRLMIEAAQLFDADLVDAAAVMASAAGRITAPLMSIIDALNAVAVYGQADVIDFSERIAQLMTDLQAVAQGIVFGLRGFGRDVLAGLEEAGPITEALGRVVAFVQSVAEALNAVAGYGQQQKVNFGQRIDALMTDLQAVARGIVFGLRMFSREVLASLDEAATTTDALGRLVAFIQGTTEALNALAGYGQTGKIDFTTRIGALMADLMATATGILAGLTTLSNDVMDGLDEAAATTDALGRLVAFVQGAIDALRALATYEAVADIGPRVRAFATDIVTVGHALRVGLGELSAPLKAAFDAAIEFAERISGIVGVIRPGMDAIASVVTYKRGSVDLRAATMRFVEDLLVVAEALRDGLGAPSQAILDAYDAAREFADRIAGMINFVQPALDVLRELNRYGGPGNLHAGVLTFLMHIEGLINALATTFQRMGPDLVRQAAEFSELIRAIVSNIVGAMRELAGLGDVAALVTAAFGVGQGWMDGLIDGLSSRLGDLVALMAYIRGLFPSSPAEHGPWRSLPQGAVVSQEWLGGMTRALGQTSGLESTLGGLRDLFVGAPMAQAALAGAGGYGGSARPAQSTTNVTFTMQGPFYIREEADIRRLAEQVGNVLAGQADMRWRMGA